MGLVLAEQTDYRAILRQRFADRQERNPAYSLRAYARDLGVSASRLSEILSGRHEMSPKTALDVASRLGMTDDEQAFFVDLVTSTSARTGTARAQATARLARRRAESVGEQLSMEHFALIAEWHHFAILELTKVKGFRASTATIASALGLPKDDVKRAVSRLCRLGFLGRDGRRLVVRKPSTRTQPAAPSDAVRAFHRQILERATLALEFQTMGERHNGGVVMAFDQERFPEARERLRRFRQEFAAEFTAKRGATHVYALSAHFFALSHPKPEDQH
jgi:uncharacterized protein (TIGR02147 family)